VAATAPLDAGVASQARWSLRATARRFQPLVGGKIAELPVKDGDVVKAGQILVRLDDTQARSQFDIARGQCTRLRRSRPPRAERTGRAQIQFPDDLKHEKSDPRAVNAMALQSELFITRRRSVESD